MNDTDLSWKTEAKNIFNKCCASTPGSFIERKQTSVGWHYRLSSEETSELKAQECRKELETVIGKKYPDIHVTMGKKVIEVRPRGVNKGEIVKRLLLTKNGKFDWVICAGDDKTDEDMFSALEDASIMMDLQGVLTCSIGPSNKETIARLYLESPEDLISLMNHLALESQ